MMLVLVLAYHLLLFGGLAIASGHLSGAEIVLAIALIALGSAALIETALMLEPRRRTLSARAGSHRA